MLKTQTPCVMSGSCAENLRHILQDNVTQKTSKNKTKQTNKLSEWVVGYCVRSVMGNVLISGDGVGVSRSLCGCCRPELCKMNSR